MNLNFTVRWSIDSGDEVAILEPTVFELLRGIRQGGHLNYAAKAAGVSYRHAWGLLRDWERRLGTALLSARQGRGAHLTEFGEALLEIALEADSALAPTLERVALDISARLSEAADQRHHPVAIVSSNSERVQALRERLSDRHRVSLDITGSETALHRYRRGDVDIAGFHLPMGELGRSVAASLIAMLDASRDQLWLLEQRTLGLLSRPQHAITTIAELPGGKLRFVNRQAGSGTRLIFDGLLGAAGIAPGSINGYNNEEFTHTAVAAMVASDSADVAFGTASAATRLNLHFADLVHERFYLVMRRSCDSSLRRTVADFCAAQDFTDHGNMKADEFSPTLAVLKRVHKAGFWKASRAAPR